MTDVDHRAIIAGLSVQDRTELTTLSDAPGLWRLAAHAGAVAVLAGLVAAKAPLWPLLMLPLGILIVFFFTLLHETTHETAFASPWLNRVVANVAGFLILIPPAWFRYFHFAHHRHTNDPDHDPELASRRPETAFDYGLYISGYRYWSGMARLMVGNAAARNGDVFVPAKGRAKIVLEARGFLALYAVAAGLSVVAQSTLLLWVWIVPVLLGQPFLRAYLLAEHARCPNVANMLENSRTTFTTAMVRFFAWNMPYHSEHHSYPTIPFHKLPRFHQVVRRHLLTTQDGYVRFNARFVRTLGR